MEDSALYDLEGFDVVWQVAVSVLYLCYEGVTKLMLKRMLIDRNTMESRQLLQDLNIHYKGMRVFTETARATRTIQVLAFKGNELAVLTPSFMPFLALKPMTRNTTLW